jgi:pimeloyl-ACP methyl ester carboxylesterase
MERTHVFGASMGGAIAQELALSQPNLVHGLVLGCTMCGWKKGVAPTQKTQPETAGITQAQSALEYIRSFWPLLTTPEFARSGQAFLQEMEQAVLQKPTPPAALLSQDAAVRAWDSYDRLPQMKVQTLIIHGDADRMVPVGNASILRERIPDAQLRILPGAGHAFMWQFPDESAQAIVEFLAAVPSAV